MGFAGLEIAKSLGPGALAFVSMNCCCAKPGGGKVPAKAVGTTFGAAENQCLIAALLQEMDEQVALPVVLNSMNPMPHRGGGAVWSGCLYLGGIEHEFQGERTD